MKVKAIVAGLTGTLTVLTPSANYAQSLAPIDPGQIQRQLPEPGMRPEVPRPPTPEAPPREVTPTPENILFTFNQVSITGATQLTAEINKIQEDFNQRFRGQTISLVKVQELRAKIEELYSENDFALVRVILPPQDITTGEIEIRVIEGFIERYEINNRHPRLNRRIKGFLENIVGVRPLRSSKLERNLLLINDLAGYEVQAQLTAGQEIGGSILILNVTYRPVNGFFETNNWANQAIGPVRLQSGVILNSLEHGGESITISGATTLFDFEELRNARLDFNIPIGNQGLSLYANTSYTETRPGDILRPLQIKGEAFTLGGGLRYAIIRSRRTNLFIHGGFEATNNSLNVRIVDPDLTLYIDRTRNIQMGLSLNHQHARGRMSGHLLLKQGIPGLGTRSEGRGNIPLSTEFGRTDAFRVNAGFSQLWQFPQDFSLQINGIGQVSTQPLLLSDQFGLGGPAFGSAYNPSQIVGDSGFGARVEAQKLFRYQIQNLPSATQGYLFFDYGQTFNQRAIQPQPSVQDLASAGLGLRTWIGNTSQIQLELGFPLVAFPTIERGVPTLRFSLQSFF